MKRDLNIIIPVHNGFMYTLQVLHSIKKVAHTSQNLEKVVVWVVDNHSTDETQAFLYSDEYTDLGKDTNIDFCSIVAIENFGYGAGANLAFHTPGDKLVMNNDMLILEGCFDALIEAAYSDEKIGVVGGRLLTMDGNIQHDGAYMSKQMGCGIHLNQGKPESLVSNLPNIEDMDYVTGALFYIKDDTFKKIGYFDEQFKLGYYEDVDYCYRARKEGLRVVVCRAAKAIHYENSTSRLIANMDTIFASNKAKFLAKYEDLV